MKALRILLLIAIMVISAGTAMAVTVTLQGSASGTYTLQSMTIDSNGNITLSVSSSTPPPPGALTLSLSPTSLPAGTVGQSYNQSVTMTATGGTSPYTYACSGSGVSGISASASGNICTISGTPTTSGNYTVNFTVTDSANATASQSLVFSVNTNNPPANCTPLSNRVNYDESISPNEVKYYCFTLDDNYSTVGAAIFTGDWATNQDIMLSNIKQPTWDDYNTYVKSMLEKYGYALNRDPLSPPWFKTSPINTESVMIYNVNGKRGQTFYLSVFNMSPTRGKYTVQVTWY